MPATPLNVNALKLAEDLPEILRAGKHALLLQYALNLLLPAIDAKEEAVRPRLRLNLLNLITSVLLGIPVDYRLGGGYCTDEVEPLFYELKAHFPPGHPLWKLIILPDGETLTGRSYNPPFCV